MMRVLFGLILLIGMIAIAGSALSADQSTRSATGQAANRVSEENFTSADTDRNLKISLEEFKRYYTKENAPSVFRSLNRDGDPYLDRDEFKAMQDISLWDLDIDRKITLQEFMSYYKGENGAQIFRELDINNDGTLGELEFNAIQSNP